MDLADRVMEKNESISERPDKSSTSEDEHDAVSGEADLRDWSDEEEGLVRRKIDYRVFPMFWIIFGLCLLDRTNAPFAVNAGMGKDLNLLVDSRYNIVLLVFFPGYFLLEIPSNAIIRRVGAKCWITFLITLWGVSVLCSGFVHDWKVLAGLRAMLGTFEAGLLPGAIFVLTCWYKPYESAKRVTALWMISQLAAAFGPILAYGLSLISVGDGIYAQGWRWIFIVEGLMTIAAGFATPFFLIEFPERANFLNKREKHIALTRISLLVQNKIVRYPSIKETLRICADWKLLVLSLQYFICASSIYSLGYFAPIILLEGFHFSYVKAQLLSAPPTFAVVPLAFGAAWISDRIKLRWPIICFQALLAIAGLLIVLYAKPVGVRYFGLFVASYGIQSNLPSVLYYVPNQVSTQEKQGVASALVISAGALGGICGSTIFRTQDAPTYYPGMWTTIGLQMLLIVITLAMSMFYQHRNQKADDGKIAMLEGVGGFRYAP